MLRFLGVLLLLAGIGLCVLPFTEVRIEALGVIETWGNEAAWGIRGGTALLGLILLMAGKKGGGKKKH